MKTRKILTESQIRQLVKESVKRLFEAYYGEPQTPEMIMDEYKKWGSHEFDMSDYAYDGTQMATIGFVYDPERNTLYAGFISNAGCNRQWEMEYDTDFTMEENIDSLYEMIINDPAVEPIDNMPMEAIKRKISGQVMNEALKRIKQLTRKPRI